MSNTLYLGDCLDKLDFIEDKSIDLVLADPPYGTTGCKWDTIIPLKELWEKLLRIVKDNRPIVLMACQPFTTTLISSNLQMFKYDWVWDKHIARGFQVAKYRPMMQHESILVFGTGRITYYPIMVKRDKPVTVRNYSKKGKISSNDIGKYNTGKKFTYTHKNPVSIITGLWEPNAGKIHPTQKPVSLMEYLIKTYTLEGETVLDFSFGSGSTGVACARTKRNFVGIELDEEYFKAASKRINQELLEIE